MVACGMVQHSNSSYSSATNLVKKKDGSTRVTIDYRPLNNITIKDAFPLPNIENLFCLLSKAKYYSKFDLASGYYQIKMSPESRKYTVFACEFGLYEYLVMPMGLTNAPATFQRLMNEVLKDLIGIFCAVYLDDIIVFSHSLQDHVRHVNMIIERLATYALKVKLSKCELVKTDIEFLGHTISQGYISPNQHNTRAIKEKPRPTSIKDVQSFVSLASYYKKFIKNFAKIAKPLYECTSREQFEWSTKCETAFITLQEALTTNKVLALSDFSKPFKLETDACDYGVGAVLSQSIDGVERPIEYFSQHLSGAELNYSTSEKELYAIVLGVEYFKFYLYDKRFEVITNHLPLQWSCKIKQPAARLARWLIRLENYDFTIKYRKGKNHINADALSRWPIDQQQCEQDNEEADFVICSINVNGAESDDKQLTANEHNINVSVLNDTQSVGDKLREEIWLDMQSNDTDIQWCIKMLSDITIHSTNAIQQRYKREKNKFVVKNGVIYAKQCDDDNGTLLKYVVPKDQQKVVLHMLHSSVFGGHLGRDKTVERVVSRFFWYGLVSDVANYAKNCPMCQQAKLIKQISGALRFLRPAQPGELVTTDIVGPLTESFTKNKYILVVVDHFTKWVYPKSQQQP
jgi:hypothetical protein